MLKVIFVVFFILFTSFFLIALDQAGVNSAVLDLKIGARPVALANAFLGMADDANAVFYNASGMLLARDFELTSSYLKTAVGLDAYYLAFLFNNSRQKVGGSAFGIYWLNGKLSDIPLVDVSEVTTEDIRPSDYSNYELNTIGLSYAKAIFPNLISGLKTAFIWQDFSNIKDSQSFAYASSIDFLWLIDYQFRLAIAIENVLGQTSWQTGTIEKLPLIFKSGIKYDPLNNISLGLQIEQTFLKNQSLIIASGLEWKVYENLSLRAGYREEYFSLGLGIKAGQVKIDYAYDNRLAESNNQISVSFFY